MLAVAMTVFGIRFFFLEAAFSGWLVFGAFLLGLWLGPRSRAGCLLLPVLGITPALLVLLDAWLGGCFARTDCMTGFGVVLAAMMGGYWMVANVAGIGLRGLIGWLRARHAQRQPPPSPAPPS